MPFCPNRSSVAKPTISELTTPPEDPDDVLLEPVLLEPVLLLELELPLELEFEELLEFDKPLEEFELEELDDALLPEELLCSDV